VTGKPNKNLPIEVQSLARAYTKTAISTLGGIAEKGESEAAQIAACAELLNRGWGKPAQTHQHTGADGSNAIEVTIRTIVEGKK